MTSPDQRLSGRLSLGDASALFGLTPRALRFYEERGLVRAHRDRRNHRYYDGEARRQLSWIATLRKVGVSLDLIAEVLETELDGGDVGRCAARALTARERELEQALERVRDALGSLGGTTMSSGGQRVPRRRHARS